MSHDRTGEGQTVAGEEPPAGDPDRFLAWVRDAQMSPVAPCTDAPSWQERVHDAFAYAERGRRRSIGEAVTARLACREGCAWCCHVPVTTTAPEVDVAWRYARERLGAAALETVRERSAVEPRSAPAPCPFLVGTRCAVYPVRPLACRAWNSTDAAACRDAHERGHDRVAIPVHTLARGVFANAAQAFARGIAERGGEPAVSLRAALRERVRRERGAGRAGGLTAG